MGNSMKKNGVDAGVAKQHLEGGACRRIAFHNGVDIVF
jgi:hypothetical protein